MARYVQPGVRDIRDNPTQGERVTLVVVPEAEPSQNLQERVTELGGTIRQELEFDMFIVEIAETAVADLCDLSGVKSVIFEEKLKVQSGNGMCHSRSQKASAPPRSS